MDIAKVLNEGTVFISSAACSGAGHSHSASHVLAPVIDILVDTMMKRKLMEDQMKQKDIHYLVAMCIMHCKCRLSLKCFC